MLIDTIAENEVKLNPLIHFTGAIRQEKDTLSSTLQILVVDDEPLNVKALVSILDFHFGLESQYAFSGAEAIRQIKNSLLGFDLIFMDIMMPKITGI